MQYEALTDRYFERQKERERREDNRVARLCFVIAKYAGAKDVDVETFIPMTDEERQQLTIDRLKQKMIAWAEASKKEKDTN